MLTLLVLSYLGYVKTWLNPLFLAIFFSFSTTLTILKMKPETPFLKIRQIILIILMLFMICIQIWCALNMYENANRYDY